MPIKPENKARYPQDWRAIRTRILIRAEYRCECEGECGLHCEHPGPRRCVERHRTPARWAKGIVVLTVAHLNHQPEDCRDDNLKAMCQRCHLRYDVEHHQKTAAETRRQARRLYQSPFPEFEVSGAASE